MIEGCVERITNNLVSGWVCVKGIDSSFRVQIVLNVRGKVVAEFFADKPREDVKRDGVVYGFYERINIDTPVHPDDLQVVAKADGDVNTLRVWDALDVALRFGALGAGAKKGFVSNLDTSSAQSLFSENEFVRDVPVSDYHSKLCIITYANDSSAWFPYFYDYYSNLVGGGRSMS